MLFPAVEDAVHVFLLFATVRHFPALILSMPSLTFLVSTESVAKRLLVVPSITSKIICGDPSHAVIVMGRAAFVDSDSSAVMQVGPLD